ncbi:MAG: J domain-containing protein [Thaumarchaeota archaeon]|nr:J domain-containing protein [Nitrososphaerota archaeon]
MSRQEASYQKKTQEPNYYEILGVARDSSFEDIKSRYKSLVLKFHPDREGSALAKEAMVSINNAYEVLSDPQKRTGYNASLNKQDVEEQSNEIPQSKRGVLPITRISKKSIAIIAITISASVLAGCQAEALSGDGSQVSRAFVIANSHYFTAIVQEALATLPLFIPGFGLAWGALGGFTLGLADKAVLATMPAMHAKDSGLFLAYFFLASALKLVAYYTGMCRSLTLLVSIRRKKFSKLDRMFTEADIIIAVILSSISGLVEHAMANIS